MRLVLFVLMISIFTSACSNTEESSQIINNLQTQIEELNIQLEDASSDDQSEMLSEMESELKALETLLKETKSDDQSEVLAEMESEISELSLLLERSNEIDVEKNTGDKPESSESLEIAELQNQIALLLNELEEVKLISNTTTTSVTTTVAETEPYVDCGDGTFRPMTECWWSCQNIEGCAVRCSWFESQALAQSWLDSNPDYVPYVEINPEIMSLYSNWGLATGVDSNGDGTACSYGDWGAEKFLDDQSGDYSCPNQGTKTAGFCDGIQHNCGSFSTQTDVQEWFEANLDFAENVDDNSDGIACGSGDYGGLTDCGVPDTILVLAWQCGDNRDTSLGYTAGAPNGVYHGCNRFFSQEDAQEWFEANLAFGEKVDTNQDGTACGDGDYGSGKFGFCDAQQKGLCSSSFEMASPAIVIPPAYIQEPIYMPEPVDIPAPDPAVPPDPAVAPDGTPVSTTDTVSTPETASATNPDPTDAVVEPVTTTTVIPTPPTIDTYAPIVSNVNPEATSVNRGGLLTVTWDLSDVSGMQLMEGCCWGSGWDPGIGARNATKMDLVASLYTEDDLSMADDMFRQAEAIAVDDFYEPWETNSFGNPNGEGLTWDGTFQQTVEVDKTAIPGDYELRIWSRDKYGNTNWTTVGTIEVLSEMVEPDYDSLNE